MSEYKYPIVKSFVSELRRIFRDPGVTVIFIVATLAYPLIYKALYWNEQITDVPVAVVDLSNSPESRAFLHKWNAAPDIRLTHTCSSMAEAEQLLRDQKVHGIIYFPRDFEKQLADPLGQAHISLYCDMSSFLYMKAIYLSCNQVMLESMRNIQIDRYEQMGMDKEFAWALVQDAPYSETALFTPTGGYGSFLIPAVLVLILHQTLLFGICMLGGTAREENDENYSFSSLLGRAGACFIIYFALAAILLGFLPRLFDIPHLGAIDDVLLLIVPYLLAVIFFSLCVSVFIRNRESGLVLLISTSLIFLFMAGISWPKEMIPEAWRYLSYFIPYTWGAHAFIHINSMGASLIHTNGFTASVAPEFISLWILAAGYFLLACGLFYVRKKRVWANK
ncbi:MAG: ABC transporter permease [Paludibacteraceae bacterium]|nr:ABC transporter permease [Paludibacteraceae bacterium]MBR0065375.1 ABC transporter permease [Paludibacteraceae bacterium]